MKIPTKRLDFMDWEFGVFFHFGIRTFYEGHKDWDLKEMNASAFNPYQLDCNQWLKAVSEAGAKYAILVCKHHDGFANWPSKYTDYSVAASPWKDGKGDVVDEFCTACRKYNLKVGLYYSPAQFGSKEMNPQEYDDYFINQISELLTNYGKIDYLWFDGCGSENHKYDTVRIIGEIRRMQPEILIFNMWDPDTRWIGNESGTASMTDTPEVNTLDFSVQTELQDQLDETLFLPAECDCRIRKNWFYFDSDKDTLKSVDELFGMYLCSVGHGANLLLNIGPDRRGLLLEDDVKRIKELHDKIQSEFNTPIATFKDFNRKDDTFTCPLPKDKIIKYVVIEEDLSSGSAVTDFRVDIIPTTSRKLQTVFGGFCIGHKAICPLPHICTAEINIVITGKAKDVTLKNITVY